MSETITYDYTAEKRVAGSSLRRTLKASVLGVVGEVTYEKFTVLIRDFDTSLPHLTAGRVKPLTNLTDLQNTLSTGKVATGIIVGLLVEDTIIKAGTSTFSDVQIYTAGDFPIEQVSLKQGGTTTDIAGIGSDEADQRKALQALCLGSNITLK